MNVDWAIYFPTKVSLWLKTLDQCVHDVFSDSKKAKQILILQINIKINILEFEGWEQILVGYKNK